MFALFAGDVYYPYGGWGDFKGMFTTVEEAKDFFDKGERWGDDHIHHWNWYQVVNLETKEIVERGPF